MRQVRPIQERDLVGYGRNPPHSHWPNGARIALSFVLNYEEGAERTPLLGDEAAETYGSEFPLSPKPKGMRGFSMESLFEYGSRAGFWRVMRLFDERRFRITIFATGIALRQNPAVAQYLAQSKHEVAGHGWRWIDYAEVPPEMEREHIQKTIEQIETSTGRRPVGWYTGRRSARTRSLLIEAGDFLYDSDSYADDLPYYVRVGEKTHLVIPYTLDCNDFRFTTSPGFMSGLDFFNYLRDAFDFLYEEGRTFPKMMSVGLHGRITGRPGRAAALHQFINYVNQRKLVWICTREEIARHWLATHPPA